MKLLLPISSYRRQTLAAAALALMVTVGCRKEDMADQPKYTTYDPAKVFADGAVSRPIPAGTVARTSGVPTYAVAGVIHTGSSAETGKDASGVEVNSFPWEITKSDLMRGQRQFTYYCSPCHGALGDGNGMISDRGMLHPPSYHSDRLRAAPVGHFFNVMTNGWGAMYSQNDKVAAEDRWRIAAYIRALQLSQNADNQPATKIVDLARPATMPAEAAH